MTPRLNLRPYQTEAISAVQVDWMAGLRVTAVVLPTGLGKTVVFSRMAADEVRNGGKVLILVHRDELVKQAVDKVKSVSPGITVGVVKAKENDVHAPVVVASVQTLRSPARMAQLDRVTMIVVDECHHMAAESYQSILSWYDDAKVVGFTATFQRNDKKKLGDTVEKISYEKDILYGIRNGYLCDVEGRSIKVPGLDLSQVKIRHGDFAEEELGEELIRSAAGKFIAAEYAEHCGDRRGVLFAPNVATAHLFAEDLNALGIVTEVITGSTPIPERQDIYKRYEAGRTQVLSNCMVLTEGWDAPHAEVAVIARPTSSQSLYIQMAGRVLRPFPGKGKALILDVMGVSQKLGLASISDLSITRPTVMPDESLLEAADREEGEAAMKKQSSLRIRNAVTETVDLFHTSKSAWMQTHKGVWFIPVRDGIWFLWPEHDGSWTVARKGKYEQKAVKKHTELANLEFAMGWAEQYAAEEDPSVSNRRASWRRKGGAPTEAQVKTARSFGLDIEGKNKTQVSDMLSVHFASRDIPMGYPDYAKEN